MSFQSFNFSSSSRWYQQIGKGVALLGAGVLSYIGLSSMFGKPHKETSTQGGISDSLQLQEVMDTPILDVEFLPNVSGTLNVGSYFIESEFVIQEKRKPYGMTLTSLGDFNERFIIIFNEYFYLEAQLFDATLMRKIGDPFKIVTLDDPNSNIADEPPSTTKLFDPSKFVITCEVDYPNSIYIELFELMEDKINSIKKFEAIPPNYDTYVYPTVNVKHTTTNGQAEFVVAWGYQQYPNTTIVARAYNLSEEVGIAPTIITSCDQHVANCTDKFFSLNSYSLYCENCFKLAGTRFKNSERSSLYITENICSITEDGINLVQPSWAEGNKLKYKPGVVNYLTNFNVIEVAGNYLEGHDSEDSFKVNQVLLHCDQMDFVVSETWGDGLFIVVWTNGYRDEYGDIDCGNQNIYGRIFRTIENEKEKVKTLATTKEFQINSKSYNNVNPLVAILNDKLIVIWSGTENSYSSIHNIYGQYISLEFIQPTVDRHVINLIGGCQSSGILHITNQEIHATDTNLEPGSLTFYVSEMQRGEFYKASDDCSDMERCTLKYVDIGCACKTSNFTAGEIEEGEIWYLYSNIWEIPTFKINLTDGQQWSTTYEGTIYSDCEGVVSKIAAAVGSAVASGIIGYSLWAYRNKKTDQRSRRKYPFANYLYRELKLKRVSNFDAIEGVEFREIVYGRLTERGKREGLIDKLLEQDLDISIMDADRIKRIVIYVAEAARQVITGEITRFRGYSKISVKALETHLQEVAERTKELIQRYSEELVSLGMEEEGMQRQWLRKTFANSRSQARMPRGKAMTFFGCIRKRRTPSQHEMLTDSGSDVLIEEIVSGDEGRSVSSVRQSLI